MFDHLPLFAETLVVITALTHPPVTSARDVRDDSVIAFPHGCAYRRVLERWLGPGSLDVVLRELARRGRRVGV